MNRQHSIEQTRQASLRSWAEAQRQKLHEAADYKSIPVNLQRAGSGIGGGQLPLVLTFDDIANAHILVGDAENVSDWNTFFELPTRGNPFSNVKIVDNDVCLIGGSNISIKNFAFWLSTHLLSVDDRGKCVISVGSRVFSDCINLTSVNLPAVTNLFGIQNFAYCPLLETVNMPQLTGIEYWECFYGCTAIESIDFPLLKNAPENTFNGMDSLQHVNLPSLETASSYCFGYAINLETISLPKLTSAGNVCFSNCTSLTSINLPSCTSLGSSTGDNGVFDDIENLTITIRVPAALMTCNSGSPDGDIQDLQANNDVTVITV